MSVRSLGLGTLSSLPDVTLSFTYNLAGSRASLTDPVGVTTYSFDNAERLVSLVNPKGENYSFGYDNGNRLVSQNRPGVNTALAFDDRNFVTSILHSYNGTLASFNYTMDDIGNRTKITTLAGDKDFSYDLNNQLTSATNPETPAQPNAGRAPASFTQETFSYDSIANRTSDQGGSYTFDNKKQRLQEDYRFFYFFDNNGNLTSKQSKFGMIGETTNFTYSSENQLLGFKVYSDGANPNTLTKEVTYSFDSLGRRVEKRVIDYTDSDVSKTFTRRFVYDGQEILLEFDGSNNLLARYTHSSLRTDDVLAADVTSAGVSQKLAQSAETFEYVKDAQGTVTDIVNTSGIKLQHYVYSAFGTILGIQDANAVEITNNPILNTAYTYTGREKDSESGYYYYRARYYDSQSGRFLQKDTGPGSLNSPISLINSYSYAGNGPTNATDPSGKSFLRNVIGVATAVASLFGMEGFGDFLMSGRINWSAFLLGPNDPSRLLSTSLFTLEVGRKAINRRGDIGVFEGRFYVQNSIMTGDRPGFDSGTVIFISGEADTDTLHHEYGHALQHDALMGGGGWIYSVRGLASAGGTNAFEMEADQRASEYFDTPVCSYHNPNHPVEQCRY